jgi:peptidoglycan/xylan/chitin deacetylase (PgdA/CDA1 family)
MRQLVLTFAAAIVTTLLLASLALPFLAGHSHGFAVTDEEELGEISADQALSVPPESSLASSSARALLHDPPLAYLAHVAGDPRVSAGEIAVRVPVLMYHHVRPMQNHFTSKERMYTVTPESFTAQMETLMAAGYVPITPDDLDRALTQGVSALPSKPVLVTLDDGFRDQYANVFPVLKRLGIKATFFIVSRASARTGSLDPATIQELDRSGLITIAAHTEHHAFLSRYSMATRHEEISGSKQDLEELLGHPITVFAYPYGSWTPEIAKEVEQAGFRLGFGIQFGSLHTPSSRYQLRRMRVLDGENVVALLDQFSK